jgi:hypothetical protein
MHVLRHNHVSDKEKRVFLVDFIENPYEEIAGAKRA